MHTLKGRAGSLKGKPSVSAASYVSSSRTWASERRMGLSGVRATARAECEGLGLGLVSEGGRGEVGVWGEVVGWECRVRVGRTADSASSLQSSLAVLSGETRCTCGRVRAVRAQAGRAQG